MVLLFLTLTGWFAAALLRGGGLSPLAAFLGGLLAQGLPFIAQEMGVLQLIALFGLLWSLYFLNRLLAEPRFVLEVHTQPLARMGGGDSRQLLGKMFDELRLRGGIRLSMSWPRTKAGIPQLVQQAIHAGQTAQHAELGRQNPLQVLATKRGDLIFRQRPRLQTLAKLLDLFG